MQTGFKCPRTGPGGLRPAFTKCWEFDFLSERQLLMTGLLRGEHVGTSRWNEFSVYRIHQFL